MKSILTKSLFTLAAAILLISCGDDPDPGPTPTGNSKTYTLNEMAVAGISGTATFVENTDNSITINLVLSNTPAGGSHPAHIHLNSAAESGGIALTLGDVNGDTGESSITITELDDNTPVTYNDLLNFDGYINVHLSAAELGTIVAQGDIGINELSGDSKSYELNSVAVPEISGSVLFEERLSGEALATISLQNTPVDGLHPAHIHLNSAAEGGDIAFTFNPVDGNTGISKTNVAELDDASPFVYSDILQFDGYVNVHLSENELETIVGQGDIGTNELTGNSVSYDLNSVADPNISGFVLFEERISGEALATISLQNTPVDGSHPAHIHDNTAVEGGGIAFTFNPVDGNTGMSKTNVAELDNATPFGYAEVLNVNGYVNVHLSANDLGTLVGQGDIGQNALTGESVVYDLDEKDVPGISGTAKFEERVNGTTLVTLSLIGTPGGGEHPAHIHENDAATTGGIAVTLTSVDGTTGMSKTQVSQLDDATPITYTELLTYNGYINVHLSAAELSTIVAQGNIGSNAGMGGTIEYAVTNSGSSAYIFNGNGLTDASNPNITLTRGMTYVFTVSTPGHPFYINSTQGTGTSNAYNNGVTNNGASSGTITFTVPNDAPDTLFYNCEFHSSMTGQFNIVD